MFKLPSEYKGKKLDDLKNKLSYSEDKIEQLNRYWKEIWDSRLLPDPEQVPIIAGNLEPIKNILDELKPKLEELQTLIVEFI